MATWQKTVSDVVRFPVVAWFLRSRALTTWILACVGAMALLHVAGLRVIFCPYRASLGVRCPGCGLTRGCVALLRGDVGRALELHAFAPAFLAAGMLLAVGMAVPPAARGRLAEVVGKVEARTGVSMLILFAVVIYGLTRLVTPG